MRTRTIKKNKVNVVTLGCAKNIVDSENLMRQLSANNFEVEHESQSEDSSIVIINTCGFIESAKQESIDTILQYAEAKNNGYIDKVYVTGCLSERYKPDLEKEIPNVDAFFGTRQLGELLKTLKADYKKDLIGEQQLSTPKHFAYFKIAEGCDRPCSFCAIPLMRGKHTSVPIEQLVRNAEKLVEKGTKEIILIAQDLTYYGLDLYGKRELANLLEQLSEVKGIEWIRLHYAYPAGFPLDVLEVMKSKENICNYIDIPLQHINDRILKSMRRGANRKNTDNLLKTFKSEIPDIAIRTTLITGYPGETQEEFNELVNWVEEMKFDRLGVFTYSHEENTHAFNLVDDVPDEIKKERAQIIMDIQSGISYENNQKLIGTLQKVLIDRKEGGFVIGRTQYDSPDVDNEVLIQSDENILIGDYVMTRIVRADHYDLYAEISK